MANNMYKDLLHLQYCGWSQNPYSQGNRISPSAVSHMLTQQWGRLRCFECQVLFNHLEKPPLRVPGRPVLPVGEEHINGHGVPRKAPKLRRVNLELCQLPREPPWARERRRPDVSFLAGLLFKRVCARCPVDPFTRIGNQGRASL